MAASINKRGSDSRFVSVFADNTPDVDITFMVPFLSRPTDHYLVGVDNLRRHSDGTDASYQEVEDRR